MVRLLSLAVYLLSECLFLLGADRVAVVYCSYPLSEGLIPLGAGRECEGKNHREREVLAALGSPLSLRFSPSRSLFPYPLLSRA